MGNKNLRRVRPFFNIKGNQDILHGTIHGIHDTEPMKPNGISGTKKKRLLEKKYKFKNKKRKRM